MRWIALFGFIAALGCGSEPELRFLEVPPSLRPEEAVVYAYLGQAKLELEAGPAGAAFRTAQHEVEGDLIQRLSYPLDLDELGLSAGSVLPPDVPCQRSCTLTEASVVEMRFSSGEWTNWTESSINARALEVLLPESERGRCRACVDFEAKSIEFESVLAPRWMTPEIDRTAVLLGFREGPVIRLDLAGNTETVCRLDAEFAASATMVEAGRLVVSGADGRLEILDLERDCEVQTATVNPSEDLLMHVAVHPKTGEIFTLDSNGRIDKFSAEGGFERVVELGALTHAGLGDVVFDDQGQLFALNGSTRYAFGSETIEADRINVPETPSRAEPRGRGVVFDAEAHRFALTIEGHGLFTFDGVDFVNLVASAGESGGLVPYRGGYLFSAKGGIMIQYAPEVGSCSELVVGAYRTARFIARFGSSLIVGDAQEPDTGDSGGSRASILKPTDTCLLRESP